MRLKELDSLEKIADKVEKITVVRGLNALLERTVTPLLSAVDRDSGALVVARPALSRPS